MKNKLGEKKSKRKKAVNSLETVLAGLSARFFSIRVEETLKHGHVWVCGLTDNDSEGLTYFRFDTHEEALTCMHAILAECKAAGVICEEGEHFGDEPTIVYLQAEEE